MTVTNAAQRMTDVNFDQIGSKAPGHPEYHGSDTSARPAR